MPHTEAYITMLEQFVDNLTLEVKHWQGKAGHYETQWDQNMVRQNQTIERLRQELKKWETAFPRGDW